MPVGWYSRLRFVLATVLLASLTRAVNAADNPAAASALPEYSIRVWQREQGLPQNSVTAVAQDRDGYLWLGTYDGLARFDGARFVTFDGQNTPALEDGRITSLFTASDGSLWIGHETGHVTQLKDGKFVSRRAAAVTPNQGITGLSADAQGKIWVLGHNGSLECVDDGRTAVSNDGIVDPSPFLLFTSDAHGGIAVSRDGLLSIFQDGKLVAQNLADKPGDTGIYGMLASRKGGLWIVSEGQIRRREGGRWVENWGRTPWNPQDAAAAIVELHNGALAFGTLNSGLYLISPGHPPRHYDRKNGLPHDWVRSLYEDPEHNLWVGTGSGGLAALREATFVTLDAPDGRNGRSVLSIAPSREGGVWVGTEGAGLYHYRDGTWNHFGEREGLNNTFIWSIIDGTDGRPWVGTWGGGLFKQQSDGHFAREPILDATTPILALFQNPKSETMWLGTRFGLVRFAQGATQLYGTDAGLVSPDVRAVVADDAGTVWFGMVGGGLGSLRAGQLRQFDRKDGLSSSLVQCLLADHDGALWIGTADGGLNRMKNGRISVIQKQEGLPSNVIGHIIDDGKGYLWLSTHNGIFRLAKTEANRCADGDAPMVTGQHYGRSEGLPSLEFTGGQAAGCQTPDGKLWFSTSAGVVTVDPRDVTVNTIRPRTVIEEVELDGLPVPLPAGVLKIPPGRRGITIRFTGLSFADPDKVRFRHRLGGLETGWQDAGNTRSVSYNYLPPGEYRFEVLACNNDGLWSPQPAVQLLTVLPFFWQTWWFRAAITLLVLAAAVLTGRALTRRRMKQRLEKAEQQHAIERERARIARDIHDDLGASLTRITLLSQSARSDMENPLRVAKGLDQIYGTAREVTRALDEIVWAVNPKHDTLDSLAVYLGKFAQDYLQAANVRCRLDLPLELPLWHLTAEVRHNVFLAFKETLNNILKHSEASEVRITLTTDARTRTFTLAIEDDGRGFAAPTSNAHSKLSTDRVATGNGLGNLQARLAEVGGRYEVSSESGKGTSTRVVLTLRAPSGESGRRVV